MGAFGLLWKGYQSDVFNIERVLRNTLKAKKNSYWDLGFKSETRSWVMEKRYESRT